MLGVDAALIAEVTGLRVRIDGTGSDLTCRLEGNALQMLGALRRSRMLLGTVRTIVPFLVRFGVRMEIVAGRRLLGRMGRGVEQDALARILSLPATRLS